MHRLVACVSNFRNQLLMMKVLLNIINAFMFSMIELLEKNSSKNIMMIHCQNILRSKKLWIWFRKNTFDSFAKNKWKCILRHTIFVNASKFLVINFMKSWVLCRYLKCYKKKFLWISLSTCRRANTKILYTMQLLRLLINVQKGLNIYE